MLELEIMIIAVLEFIHSYFQSVLSNNSPFDPGILFRHFPRQEGSASIIFSWL